MSVKQYSLGDFELTAVSDGTYVADGGAFFGVVPKTLWLRKVKADDLNRITVSCNSVLIQAGNQNILIETGIGNKLAEKTKSFFLPQENLLNSLHEAGVAPEDIDVVINSHLAFRSLWMEHGLQKWRCRPNVSQSEVLRAQGRVGAWRSAAGTRSCELYQ